MNIVKHDLLFCPGPVNVAKNVWQVTAKSIGHREEEFSDLLTSLTHKLLKVYEVKNQNHYYPVFITGSGTAANETILSSIVGVKHILILINGDFGERLYNTSALHNKHTHKLVFEWCEEINTAQVEQYLQHHKIDIIAMVHHETSTGMLNPVKDIGELAHKYKAQLVVDTISSAPVEKLDIENWHVTFCSASSGKAFSSLPGLGIIIGERNAFEELREQPTRTTYLNLYNLYHFSKTIQQTPNTPAVHLFLALDKALTNILALGVEKWRQTIRERALMLRRGMRKLGLHFLIDEHSRSSILTIVIPPEHITVDVLKKKLKEKRIIIYDGKGPLLDNVFQVGNIGELTKSDINHFLCSLKDILGALEDPAPKRVQAFEDPEGRAFLQRRARRRIGDDL
jgi:2-aminoethylphosphonate-pyruvate transaminase